MGINLRTHLYLVLNSLGFDVTGKKLTTSGARQAEQGYIVEIHAAVSRNYPPNQKYNNAVHSELSHILQRRAQDPRYAGQVLTRVTDFSLASTVESKALFDTLMTGYSVSGTSFRGYETILDNWLADNGIAAIGQSRECIVLLSLAYNGKDKNHDGYSDLLGPNLAAALKAGDRAEAWYEIRYNSNGGDTRIPGIAKRRFYEADTFGLYNPNPTEEDYKAAYRTLTRHRDKILDYENDPVMQRGFALAKSEFGSTVQSLADHLKPAHDALVAAYAPGAVIDVLNLFVGQDQTTLYGARRSDADRLQGTGSNDLILGESGNDTLIGGGGDDVLVGGTGNDTLEGGAGDDLVMGGQADRDALITAGAQAQGSGQWGDWFDPSAGDQLLGFGGRSKGVHLRKEMSWKIDLFPFSIRFLVVALWLFAAASAQARQDCWVLNERDKETCVVENYKEADQELNFVYQRLIRSIKKPESAKKAQRAWIQFRNAECSFVRSWETLTNNGPFINWYTCLERLTLERIKGLEYLLKSYENRSQEYGAY